jgi:photosystem II stability/assembly factor-like uncharacterized protein
MNNHRTPAGRPGARCQTYAALLPILDEPDTDPDALVEARAHLSACASCQEQLAAYRQLAVAARRYLGPPAAPRYQTSEIMRDLLAAPIAALADTEPASPITARPLPRKPASPRRLITTLAPIAAVLVIVLLTVALFANHLRPQGVASIPARSESRLTDISMVSPSEGWAVGDTESCGSQPISTPDGSTCRGGILLLHYLDGTWSPVHLPFQVGGLTTISALSATDVWAGGNTLILHYDGHTWRQMPNPQRFILSKMQMLSDTDGWAVGADPDLYNPGLLLHYDGKSWTEQPLPASLGASIQDNKGFDGLTMISPTEGWVIGDWHGGSPAQIGIILHYTHGQWAIQDRIDNASLTSISMLSATDGWATGYTTTYTPANASGTPPASNGEITNRPFLLHYTRGKWVPVTNSLSGQFNIGALISMTSAQDGWMMSATPFALWHYNGQDWLPVAAPALPKTNIRFITRLEMLSPTEGWAIGFYGTGGRTIQQDQGQVVVGPVTFVPLILHYHNGVWSVVNISS